MNVVPGMKCKKNGWLMLVCVSYIKCDWESIRMLYVVNLKNEIFIRNEQQQLL